MRKSTVISLNDNGTDKKFRITQFPARQQQNFIMRLAFCLCESEGARINFLDVNLNGMATEGDLFAIGETVFDKIKEKGFALFAGIDADKAQALLDELTGCCKLVIDKFEADIDDANVENYKTLTQLQWEAFKFNFFTQEALAEEGSASPTQAVVGRQRA